MKIYVASSWRNQYQQEVVELLRKLGHEVYDFMNPPAKTGFQWSEIDPNWKIWTPKQWRKLLENPIAEEGFNSVFNAMKWADVCVMVLPCGRSANTEAGWMAGSGKRVFVYVPEPIEPELMYKIYDGILCSAEELIMQFTPHTCIDCISFAECILQGAKAQDEACEDFDFYNKTLEITDHGNITLE